MNQVRSIKGTHDILPEKSIDWQELENQIHKTANLYGYGEIRTPIIENAALFNRGVGPETDIVSKEMYSWDDRDKSTISLRPEMTAPVVRAFIESGFFRSKPLCKLFYIDALFRREKPQKGRQRQFHQFGVEAFGSSEIEQDIEVILMATKVLCHLGIDNTVLQINNIGNKDTRKLYQDKLSNYFTSYKSKLSKISLKRLEINPLRISLLD